MKPGLGNASTIPPIRIASVNPVIGAPVSDPAYSEQPGCPRRGGDRRSGQWRLPCSDWPCSWTMNWIVWAFGVHASACLPTDTLKGGHQTGSSREAVRFAKPRRAVLACLLTLTLALPVMVVATEPVMQSGKPWCDVFSPQKAELSDTGKNHYWFLWPGYRLLLQQGKRALSINVLTETKMVDGVRTRVVEERETTDGRPTKVSRNYFAISLRTGDVYFFGAQVDCYTDGKITGHQGSWLAGVNGAKFGLMMPGRPDVGDRYCQAVASGVAMSRAEIISRNEDFTTPRATFENCLRIRQSDGSSKDSEDKLYARDVGLIKCGDLILAAVDRPLCKGENDVPVIPFQ